ncbi:hypothetical protein DMB95_00150 [Campylobacter sp. MIT 12-8780]|nr:hypothetical protein DMB95_00150 [Campylobacter sp. MIT 12-8780]
MLKKSNGCINNLFKEGSISAIKNIAFMQVVEQNEIYTENTTYNDEIIICKKHIKHLNKIKLNDKNIACKYDFKGVCIILFDCDRLKCEDLTNEEGINYLIKYMKDEVLKAQEYCIFIKYKKEYYVLIDFYDLLNSRKV